MRPFPKQKKKKAARKVLKELKKLRRK